MSNFPKRAFSAPERDLIRAAHAGQSHIRQLLTHLRTSPAAIYREFTDMGLPYRKPDCRRLRGNAASATPNRAPRA